MAKTAAKRGVKKKIPLILIVIIAVLIIILSVVAISMIQQSEKDSNALAKQLENDPLVIKCMQSFTVCKDNNLAKNGITIVLLDKGKFSSELKAKDFFDKWKAPLLQENFNDEVKTAKYPIVLLASSLEKGSVKINFVIACENSGEIVDWMNKQLDCS